MNHKINSDQNIPKPQTQKIPEPPDGVTNSKRSPRTRPQIPYNNQPMRKVTKWSLDAIKLANQPPKLFQQGGMLVRIRKYEDYAYAEPLTLDALRGHLDRAADFVRIHFRGKSKEWTTCGPPPLDFVRDVMALPGWPEDTFPILKGIVQCPYFTHSGRLVVEQGYNAESQLWFEPSNSVKVDPVSTVPSNEDIDSAKNWLLDELFADFPFQNETDRTNALAYMLTPFVREMVNGPVPLAMIEAPVAGTGKGLLANALSIPATGQLLETIPQRNSDEEWRKAITAKLIELPAFILLDNLTGTLRSPALEAALTSERWTDRILGETRMVRLNLRSIWLATANNLQIAGDLPRRVVWIRLDAKMERPEERKTEQFRHADLLKWARQEREKLVWSALTLIQAWISKGKESGTEVMGSFESWVEILGGIVNMIGAVDFLKNIHEKRRDADENLEHLRRFVLEWGKKFEFQEVTAAELYEIVAEKGLVPFVMSAETEIGKKQKLGKFLAKSQGRTVGCFQIIRLTNLNRQGCRVYKLEKIVDDQQSSSEITDPPNLTDTEIQASLPDQHPDLNYMESDNVEEYEDLETQQEFLEDLLDS